MICPNFKLKYKYIIATTVLERVRSVAICFSCLLNVEHLQEFRREQMLSGGDSLDEGNILAL